MSPERKKLIERAVLNKIRQELYQHKAPLSLYALADRVRTVEVEISEDFESDDEVAESQGGYVPIRVKYELEFNDLVDSILSASATDLYFYDNKVGLKYFWELEIYKLIISHLPDHKVAVSSLYNYLTEVINTGTTVLSNTLLQKNGERNGNNQLEQMVINIINQYPKVFTLSSNRSEILLNKKADLRLTVANFAFINGETTWDKSDRVSLISKPNLIRLINESDYYFKDFQKPVEISDINSLIKTYGSWFEDSKDYLIFKHLSPVREALKANYNFRGKLYGGRAIIAFYFIGEDFPIKDAESFVKLKKVLNLSLYSWNHSGLLDLYLNPEKKVSDFWQNIKMILPKDTDIKTWVASNIAISRVDGDRLPFKLEQIYPEMILYYSPILNLDDNPGNLFKMSIQEKIEQYKSETA